MKFEIKNNFLTLDQFQDIKNLFNEKQIIDYCNDEEVSEHDASLHGNYSFPAEYAHGSKEKIFSLFNDNFFKKTTERLLGKKIKHTFSYANFHYDMPESYLGMHNDLKDYRWLITAQLYIDGSENDGVILYNQQTKQETQVLCLPNTFYCLFADPFSWHYVKPLKKEKKSLLIRWGQKKIYTVTNEDADESSAILIIGDFHHNDDDLKIGIRLQNITESILINQGYKNIYNSPWKNSKAFTRLLFYLLKKYKNVCLVPAGYIGNGDLFSKSCVIYTDEFKDYNSVKEQINLQSNDVFKVTKSNLSLVKETIFNGTGIDELAQAEKILYNCDVLSNYTTFNSKDLL